MEKVHGVDARKRNPFASCIPGLHDRTEVAAVCGV
jgi:hypothetical protein